MDRLAAIINRENDRNKQWLLLTLGKLNLTTSLQLELNNEVNSEEAKQIAFIIKNNTKLSSLILERVKFQANDYNLIIEALQQNKTITNLTLARINHLPLVDITLQSNEREREALQINEAREIAHFLKTNTTLKTLNYRGGVNSIEIILNAIQNNNHLKLEKLSCCQSDGVVTENLITKLRDTLNIKTTLNDLKIKGRTLSRALNNTNIMNLMNIDLSFNYIGDEEVIRISELLFKEGNNKLKCLDMSSCSMTSKSGVILVDQIFNTGKKKRKQYPIMEALDLSHNKIGVKVAKRIAYGLQQNNTKLKELNLELCRLTNKGLIEIFNSLKHNNVLTELNISKNSMDPSVISTLVELLRQNTSLNTLIMYENRIGNDGLRELLTVLQQHNTTLTSLDIRQTKEPLGRVNAGIGHSSAQQQITNRIQLALLHNIQTLMHKLHKPLFSLSDILCFAKYKNDSLHKLIMDYESIDDEDDNGNNINIIKYNITDPKRLKRGIDFVVSSIKKKIVKLI
eukprot:Pgem_evm1s18886